MTPRDEMLVQMAAYLEREAPTREAWDGDEQSALMEVAGRIRHLAQTHPVVGYVIAERHVYGPDKGRLDADWDGLIHEDRATALAALTEANAPFSDDPTQTPSDHWKLYELREVAAEFGSSMHELCERYPEKP